MKKFLQGYLDDLLLLVGCGCILFGLSLWNAAITWVVAGGMLIVFGLMVGKARL